MNETENEFEYIDLDVIDEKEENEDTYDPIIDVRFQKSPDDEVFIVGVKI